MEARLLNSITRCVASAIVMLFAMGAGAQPAKKVTLRLDWTTLGYHAPFYLGVAKGYYRDAGLDVEVLEGKGPAPSSTW